MSGLCGIWTPLPDARDLAGRVQQGLDAMVHRGRDGFAIFPDRNVAIGHCLFDTGCNGMAVDEDGFAAAFDGRLDNRSEVIDAIRLDGGHLPFEQESLSDKGLLLAAYRHFRERLPEMLVGDFAIAIWDPEQETLFLCRDHFGVRPLFYRQVGQEVCFASEVKGLAAMAPRAPLTVRDKALMGFVQGELDESEPARTFYNEVFRLLPGHCATIGADGIATGRYWTLDPELPRRDRDGAERLRKLLAQAIDRRLKASGSAAALLSGGIDSSSIVSMIGARETMADPTQLDVFSMTLGGEGDETPYIEAVTGAYPVRASTVPINDISAFQFMDDVARDQGHPPPAPNISAFRHLLREVSRRSEARVLLHGHGGDEVLSLGSGLWLELAETGRWLQLWRALGENAEVMGPRPANFFRLLRRRGLRGLKRRLTGRWQSDGRKPRDPRFYTADGTPRPSEQIIHLKNLTSPLFTLALELNDHEAAAAGIDIRMPFLDLDLVSFCVTAPAEEKWAKGLSRALLRKALAGILPGPIAERKDKFDFGDRIQDSMIRDHAPMIEQALHAHGGWIAPYTDLAVLRETWRRLQQSPSFDPEAMMRLWRAVIMSRWLQLASAVRRQAGASPETYDDTLAEAAE